MAGRTAEGGGAVAVAAIVVGGLGAVATAVWVAPTACAVVATPAAGRLGFRIATLGLEATANGGGQ